MHEQMGADSAHFDRGAVGISNRRGTCWRDTGRGYTVESALEEFQSADCARSEYYARTDGRKR
jgi:hypothetical protein